VSVSLLLCWREGVTASADGAGTVVVHGPAARVTLRQVPVAIQEALQELNPPGAEQVNLSERIGRDGEGGLARWFYHVQRLTQRGLLCWTAQDEGTSLATLSAVAPSFVARPVQVVAGRRYALSRFAYLRREGNEAVLESPLAHARIRIQDCRAAALVAALATPAAAGELADRVGVLTTGAVDAVLTLLLSAGMLDEGGAEESHDLQTWEFHDLLFHARSRRGRWDAPYGGTYRFADRLAPPPALKPIRPGQVHELYRPDVDVLERDDPPLARVQAQRRSIREFDETRPITDRQLGEFLFRVGRVVGCRETEVLTPVGPLRQEFALRPYPAGGSLYELELYAVVQTCVNLAPGLYHYDPVGHLLTCLRGRTEEVRDLLRDSAASTGCREDGLQVLLIVSARFARVAWKYESIAYALMLKHVGVLYQTTYLAATAMGLGACAIGGGDADLFSRAAGTDYYAETSVGEFLLGVPRPQPGGRGG
jgi:oxazoline/thiazoline dehydrogenase